jgi:hypothetical protein
MTAATPVVYHLRRLTSHWLKHVHDRELHTDVYTLKTGSYNLQVPRIVNPGGAYVIDAVTTSEIPTGTVLGKITASGKLVPSVSGAADGSETPVGILFEDVDVSAGDQPALVVEGFARVVAQELVWDASYDTQAKKDAALAILAAKWIKVAPVV